MPLLTTAALHRLADACLDVAVPPTGPLPGAYRRSTQQALENALAEGTLALRDAIAELEVAVVELDHALLANVNTTSDVQRLRAVL
jgi:molybdopterin-guanine dinucleotide biosynthesis protein A